MSNLNHLGWQTRVILDTWIYFFSFLLKTCIGGSARINVEVGNSVLESWFVMSQPWLHFKILVTHTLWNFSKIAKKICLILIFQSACVQEVGRIYSAFPQFTRRCEFFFARRPKPYLYRVFWVKGLLEKWIQPTWTFRDALRWSWTTCRSQSSTCRQLQLLSQVNIDWNEMVVLKLTKMLYLSDLTSEERQLLLDIRRRKQELLQVRSRRNRRF